MERRLAAILAADVIGYSRLMGANEVATLTALREIRTEVFETEIAGAGGRIVKLMGDGILAEFTSVVHALGTALAIQKAVAARNADIPEDRQILFRMGVNIGDVLIEDGDVFGDGVNVAARLEALSLPGCVAVSGVVRDQVGNRLDIVFEAGGDQQLKNISGTVAVFHVRPQTDTTRPVEPGSGSRPSIAVLPFANLSGDPEQEYFADGITEDLITDLSKLSGLFVVCRNSAFVYKGRPANLQDVARDLGVRTVLEGSVRRAGNRVRITAQLIDGLTGGHIWAERYDREFADIFDLQDEITRKIIDQLQVRLLDAETENAASGKNSEAYSLYLKGRQFFHMRARKYLETARQLFLEALQHDPEYARAYAGLADSEARLRDWYGKDYAPADIIAMARRAIDLEPELPEAHAALGLALQIGGENEAAAKAYQDALTLDPLCFDAHHNFGRYYRGQLDHARSAYHFIRALEIRPDDYRSPLLLNADLNELGRTEEADRYLELGIRRAEDAMVRNPDNPDPLQLVSSVLAGIGRLDEARAFLNRALDLDPTGVLTNGYNVACAYALLGDTEQALDWLEKIYPGLGHVQRVWMRNDPDFDVLRDHPRFRKMLGSEPD